MSTTQTCPDCGKQIIPNSDGTFPKHLGTTPLAPGSPWHGICKPKGTKP